MASLLLEPPVEIDQVILDLRVEFIGIDVASGVDSETDLLEVAAAIRAIGEVGLKAAPLAPGEGVLEVIGDQRYRLPADKITVQDSHRSPPFDLEIDDSAELAAGPVK